MNIHIYTKTDCPYCVMAKAHLDEYAIAYTTSVVDDVDERQALYDRLGLVGGQRTVPQIIVDDERIGGYADLLASDVVARTQAGTFDAEF